MKMIRIIILIPVFFFSTLYAESKEWKVKSGKVFFKSETDLESIYGDGQGVKGTLNLDTKEIYIEITLGSIRTSNNLQTSHLHDNYFEIQKFPTAKFIGKVLEIKNEGEVKTVGSLELHGVKKENVEITGNLSKLGADIEQTSYFTIRLSEYNIEVPKLVFLKVNQDIKVKVNLIWSKE